LSKQKDDDELAVQGLISGERPAFEAVYRRHNGSMVRVASAILHNCASAEEIAQETWMSVMRNIGGFEGRSSLAGWIFAILTNKAKTRAKRDGRSVSLDTSANDDSIDDAFDGRGRWKDMPELWDEITPDRVVNGRQILSQVSEAIEQLPPAQRAVLILRGQQELDAAEVCDILGLTEGNVRVLLHRARFSLRQTLDRIERRKNKSEETL
jgi:RNA polymerase sigma-70 factor (ECF subfamily)